MTPRALLAAALAATLAGMASGQSTLDRSVLTATAAPTDAQKAAIGSFASKHAAAIEESSNPADLEAARLALVAPSRDPAATPAFRKAYATVLVAELGPVAKGSDLRRAVNAMQVLRFTRSPDALDVILERAAPSAEPDAGKRIAAGSLAIDAFEDLDAANVYYESAARRLRDASAAETDWLALQQKFAAIATAARRKDLPGENSRNVRRAFAEAMAAVAKASKASTAADPRMQAVQRALVGLRNDLLAASQADRSALAKSLMPALVDVVAAASAQWSAGHADKALDAAYGSTMNSCEVILRLVDRGERPQAYAGTKPEGDTRVLAAAWESGDKARFDAELKRWTEVVSAAPYR